PRSASRTPGNAQGGGNPDSAGTPGSVGIDTGERPPNRDVIKPDREPSHLLNSPVRRPSSGGSSSGGGMPSAGSEVEGKPKPAPALVHINRDWYIPIECTPDGVLVHNTGQRIALADLMRYDDNPLTKAVIDLIAKRQKTVPDGAAPWKPQIRFLVSSKGLRAYYLAYPRLEELNIPMLRVNTDRNY
ncbi:MAG: hypothetical protein AB7K24_32725, partial [Gemmataceae bacterium]